LESFLKDDILGVFGKIPLERIAILHIFSYFSIEFWRNNSKWTFFNNERQSRAS